MISITQQNLLFLWHILCSPVINYFTTCRKKRQVIHNEDFLPSCRNGDLETVKHIVNTLCVNLNEGMLESVKYGHINIVEYLISKGADDLNNGLRIACINNNSSLAELFVQKGAKIVYGLRVSKSPNITRMLYRYEQNSELIN